MSRKQFKPSKVPTFVSIIVVVGAIARCTIFHPEYDMKDIPAFLSISVNYVLK